MKQARCAPHIGNVHVSESYSHITSDAIAEIMEDSYIFSEKFMEGLRRVGPGSQFWYRSRFDPLTVNEYRMIVEYESKVDLDDQ